MVHTGPLSEIFLAHLRGGTAVPQDLEGCLQQLLARCAAAWRELELPVPLFLQHLATIMSGMSGPPPGALHVEDLYLACACAQGLPAAHAAFERLYLARVPAWLSDKAPQGTLAVLAEEVQQMLREQLLVGGTAGPPRIARYGGRGKLLSWVRIACLRTVAGLGRGAAERRTEVRDPASLELVTGEVNPEMEWMKAHYRQEFADAFRAALLALPGAQRNLLRLHLVEGLSIDRLGPLYHLSRATMARRLDAARQAVLENTEQLLKERLGLPESQVRSLARLLRSQIDISLCSLLSQKERLGPTGPTDF